MKILLKIDTPHKFLLRTVYCECINLQRSWPKMTFETSSEIQEKEKKEKHTQDRGIDASIKTIKYIM